jgi:hypothetical protein
VNDDMLTLDEIEALIGDDVGYWMHNPFVDRDMLTEKVRWWVTRAVEATRPIPPVVGKPS